LMADSDYAGGQEVRHWMEEHCPAVNQFTY
jgi:hypothetical protein